jgi:hypothetical protein
MVVGSVVELATHDENASRALGDALEILQRSWSGRVEQAVVCYQHQMPCGDSSLGKCAANVAAAAGIDAGLPGRAEDPLCLLVRAPVGQSHGTIAMDGLAHGSLLDHAAGEGGRVDAKTGKAVGFHDEGLHRRRNSQQEVQDAAAFVGTTKDDVEAEDGVLELAVKAVAIAKERTQD